MTEEQTEMIFDLLAKKAVYGLDESEQNQLDIFESGTLDAEFHSLEVTAAAISMVGISANEPLPQHLLSKINSDADEYFGVSNVNIDNELSHNFSFDIAESERPARSWFGWLGWAVAAAACVAFAVNIGLNRFQPIEQAKAPLPVELPKILTPAQMRDEMLQTTKLMIKANWAAGNVKELKEITGDVVWSDEKQAGYMRLSGLPVNDVAKETYQLWIFDKNQETATPVDGGIFDVNSVGEIVIPINAKLKAQSPDMFAITVEKPGGVVVSKREKIIAIAKVENQTG